MLHLNSIICNLENTLILTETMDTALIEPTATAAHLNGVLADAERVPQLDGLVARARHDLPVVSGERDAEDVARVPDEAARRLRRLQVPQPQRVVPRAGQRKVAVRRHDDVGHEVAVAAH